MRIGLTGGIGSGKSTVAKYLIGTGARLIDTDAIAHALTQPAGAAMSTIADVFGPDYLAPDGGMNRAAMRSLVFSDPEAKLRLEAILHPLIGAEVANQERLGDPYIVFDVPLLVESTGWRHRVDRVLVVDCDTETQVRRVCQRAGWDATRARAVIAAQATRAARRAAADAVIVNQGLALHELQAEVVALADRWRAL